MFDPFSGAGRVSTPFSARQFRSTPSQRHRNPRLGGIRSAGARLPAAWHSRQARDFTETTASRRHASFPRPRPATCFLVYDAEGSVPSPTAQPYIVPAAEGSVAQPSCGVAHAKGSRGSTVHVQTETESKSTIIIPRFPFRCQWFWAASF